MCFEKGSKAKAFASLLVRQNGRLVEGGTSLSPTRFQIEWE
jgi:hypothetical protein